jgi:hypothetical protein
MNITRIQNQQQIIGVINLYNEYGTGILIFLSVDHFERGHYE